MKSFLQNKDSYRNNDIQKSIDNLIDARVNERVEEAIKELKQETIEKFNKETMKKMMAGMAREIGADKKLLALLS